MGILRTSVATILLATIATLAVGAGVAACTETPSSFPPCILDSPCPDAAVLDEGGDDGGDAADVTTDGP